MKIIFDARHIKNIYSGLARYTYSTLNALIKSKLYSQLKIVLDKNHDYNSNPLFLDIKKQLNDKIEIIFLDAPLFKIKHHLNVSKYVNESNCDVYFYPHFDLPLFVKKRSIFVVHDLLPLVVDNYILKFKFLKQMYFKNIIKINLKKSNTECITVSNSTKQDIINYIDKNVEKKIKVVYESSFDNLIITNDKKNNNVYSVLNTKYLFYIGDRRPHKNLKQMIDVFTIMKEKYNYEGNFVIAGSPKNFDFDLDNYCRNKNYIKLIGKVSDEELSLLYKNMEALFFLSKYEGFGLPVIEAAKLNKKIITSNTSSLKEIAPPWSLVLDINEENEILAKKCLEYCKKNINIDNTNYIKNFSWEKSVKEIFKDI